MATIDKFMVRTPNPSKERLSTKKCTSSEISQDSEGGDNTKKRGKCGQLKAQADEDASKEDVKINGEAGKAVASTESTVEISYEDYLTENCDDSVAPDLSETESQNAGRDIRSFFSKGPATFKLQNPSFSTIKVKAEIHEPCSRLSGEAFARKSPVLLPGILGKQKDGRRKCGKGRVEITDDDLVIECLDGEMNNSDEAGGGLLKAPAGLKSNDASGLLMTPDVIDSTLKNSDTDKLEHETIIGELQIMKDPIPVKVIDTCGESSAKPEVVTVSVLNGSVTERQNLNDVLMGRQKQVGQEPDFQKKKQNSDGVSSSSKEKKADGKKRGRDKGSQVNGRIRKECNGADAGDKSVTRDDEETRVYALPALASVDEVVIKPPVSPVIEVADEEASELPKEFKPNAKIGKLAMVNMNQTASDVESSKLGASPVIESDGGTTLRRSQRRSAVAAIAAISIAVQETCSKRQRRTGTENDVEDETIDLDSDAEQMPEDAKTHPSRRANVPTKSKPNAQQIQSPGLAPIFMKQGSKDSSKRPTPKLSAAEREAIQMRRNFLLSGVPVELKKIQNIQQSAWPLLDAPFPKHSHTYQDISADEGGNNGAIQPWCLPEVDLKLRGPSETLLPSVDVGTIHLGQLTSLSNDDKGIDADKIELGNLMEISKDMLPVLLSEVKLHNPLFPTDRVYRQLSLRKNNNRDSKAKPNDVPKASSSPFPKEATVKSKKVSKRKKGGHSDPVQCENAEDDCSETQSLLWTEKYAPTRANEIIDNWDACKKLRDWLTEWRQVVSRHSSNGNFKPDRMLSDDVSGDFESSNDISNYSDDDSGALCNTMLLLGAHGIGKTSMVYALAQELDFKVFEVNASGSRDGRYVLTQLQEATQSHQVSRGHRTDAAASGQHEEPITDQAKDKTLGIRPKTPKKSNPVAGFLERWSAKQLLFEPEEPPPKKKGRRTKSTECRSPSKKQQQQQPQEMKNAQNQETRKPSLILFDEVDTVFDDDRGFWSAVQTFMKTTKRPIILTATDRRFVDKFGGRCETLQLRTPKLVNTTSYVQLICLLENIRTSYSDLLALVESFNGDIRRTLLSLQYWVDSGAARHLVSDQPVRQCGGVCHKESHNLVVPEPKAEEQVLTGSGVTDQSKAAESDDDFQSIVPRKRRRIQIWSDDESSSYNGSRGPGSLSSPAKNGLLAIEDVSQSCSLAPSDSEFRFDSEAAVDELKATGEGLLLPLHRLSGQVLRVNDSVFGPLTQDLQRNCVPHVFGSCQHQKSPILDQVIQHLQQSSITKREFCAEGSVRNDDKTDDDCKMPQASLKSLHDAYTTVSYTDIYCRAMRQRCANEDMRGNTYWHLEDKAEEAIDALEALVLSVSGVCQKDREGKQNASSVEKETAGPSDDDNPTRNNCYSRLLQENTSIIEGVKQSILQPPITLYSDYLPALRAICKSEELRKTTSHRRRFYHHLSNVLPTMRCSLFKNMALQFP